jgi:hypothetical protein
MTVNAPVKPISTRRMAAVVNAFPLCTLTLQVDFVSAVEINTRLMESASHAPNLAKTINGLTRKMLANATGKF